MKMVCVSLSVLFCLATARAQEEMFQPAPEVQKFAGLVGTWEGSGSVMMSPDGEASEWTSASTYRWVLGGHFLREDTVIRGEGMGEGMAFRGLMGWDRENKRYISYSLSNMGVLNTTEVHWTADDTMVSVSNSMEGSEPAVDRWVTHLGKGALRFTGHRAVGAGEFFLHVQGEGKRVSTEVKEIPTVQGAFMPEAISGAEEMKRIGVIAGKYQMKGWVIPAAGADPMQISGSETIEPIYGGTALEVVTVGDPAPEFPDMTYEGMGWFAWNQHDQRYDTVFLNSMGELGRGPCWWSGNSTLIMTMESLYQGQPMVGNYIMELGEGGRLKSSFGHSIMGDSEPQKTFEATYIAK
ncbi:MAG: DUF1579 family protein [Planctomycetota bacterium]